MRIIKTSYKQVIVGILMALVVVGCIGCKSLGKETSSSKTDLKKVTFVLDWTPNTNHTGVYVAQSKGYFTEAGLDVEIVQPPEGGVEALIASGKAQFGVSFQDGLVPAFTGNTTLPITAVAALVQHNTSGIISRKGEGLDNPKGLEGKNYATWDMDIEKTIMSNVVEASGGDFKKVNLIPSTVTDEVTALKSNSVDAIWVFYGWAGIAAQVKGLETDYFYFKDINPVFDYYSPVLIANNDFLKNDKETAKAFLNALKKGYEDAIANPQEAADILLKAAPELDPELVVKSQEWLAGQYKAEVKQWGYIDASRWNGFYQWLNENQLVESAIPNNTGFSNEYLPE